MTDSTIIYTHTDEAPALAATSDEELDAPAPERLRSFCPTVGHAFNMMGGLHAMMHAGQLVAVRRQLNLPVAL